MARPLKYGTVEELQKIIDVYFKECDPHWEKEDYYDFPIISAKGNPIERDYNAPMTKQWKWVKTQQEPYTMAGLARRMGMDRGALADYHARDRFSLTIKEARARVQEYNERHLLSGKNVAGAIFNLKVNFAYRENPDDNPPPDSTLVFINNVGVGVDPSERPDPDEKAATPPAPPSDAPGPTV